MKHRLAMAIAMAVAIVAFYFAVRSHNESQWHGPKMRKSGDACERVDVNGRCHDEWPIP